MSTITGTVTQSVTIGSGGYASPLTIAAGATVAISGYYAAIYSANAASITNLGSVTSTYGSGVQLAAGGSLDNTGRIDGYLAGVLISGAAGTVTNSGRIQAGSYYGTAGVSLGAGGTVDNSGTAALIEGYAYGVEISGGAGTVTNAGSIKGGSGIVINHAGAEATNTGTVTATGVGGGGIGIALYRGGSISNDGTAALVDASGDAILIEGSAGTVTNSGTLQSQYGFAAALKAGGAFDNAGYASGGVYVGAGGTVVNSGTIAAGSTAVVLAYGGLVNNTGSIAGSIGIDALSYATVVNSDLISAKGRGGVGVYLYAGGSVTNSGSIGARGFGSAAIALLYDGGITNTGTVKATGVAGSGIVIYGYGNVDNSGTAALIRGFIGVYDVGAVGTVTNSGVIKGGGAAGTGIDLAGGGTVVDSGIVSGAVAIYFGGYGDSLLQLAPGASISGKVVASGTANLIELTSAAASGTLSGLGDFSGFYQITLDAGAAWRMSGDASFATITSDGTILAEGGDDLVLGAFGGGTGTVEVASSGTAEFKAAVGAGQSFLFTDKTGTLRLDHASAFAAAIGGFHSGDVIDLFGQAATKLAFANGQLKVFHGRTLLETLKVAGKFVTADFVHKSDGHGGTDITLIAGHIAGQGAGPPTDFAAGVTGPPDFWTMPG